MKKKVISLVLSSLLLTGSVFANSPKVNIDGQSVQFDGAAPIIKNNRVLVPMRNLFEQMNKTVIWSPPDTITIIGGNTTIQLKIGNKIAFMGADNVQMDVPAEIINDKTFVPLRFVAEALNSQVIYDENTDTVNISTTSSNTDHYPTIEPTNDSLQKDTSNGKNLFNLSNDTLQEAIDIGKKGLEYVNSYNDNFKLPISADTLHIYQPNVWISTPYFNIVRDSALKSMNYEDYSLEQAKEFIRNNFDNVLPFELQTFGDSIDMGNTFNVVMKQGDKIIHPIKISGRDKFANRTSKWPYSPAYYKIITPYFPANEIDFNKQATLIFLYAGKDHSVSYTVDFNKYK